MKRDSSIFLLPIALGALAGCSQKSLPDKPNVIIIYADDVGYGDLSCYGATEISTPNVDRFASESLRFTNAHSTSATSTPSRYGLLTGQYPWRREGTGIAAGDAAMIISPSQYTLADMMKSVGYTTAAIGKWHLGLGAERGKQNWNGEVSPALSDIGFDYSYILAATGDRVPCVYFENGKVVNLDANDPIEVSYSKPFKGEPTGKNNPELLRIMYDHGHDQAIVNGIPRIGYMRGGKSALWVDEEIADNITERAVNFITANKDTSFFLYFGTNDIHVPRVPHPRFVGKSGMGPRGDAILSFDWTVGEIMRTLDKLGIAKNTLVIISSDNGPVVNDGYVDQSVELLGNHKPWGPWRGGKYSAFEAGTRVPMMVRWGKNSKRGVSKALFSHIDIYTSLASLVKANVPLDAAPDSENAFAVLMGKDDKGRDYVIEQNLEGTLSVLSGAWKYISPSNGPAMIVETNTELGNLSKPQLYNLEKDPNEQNNLAEEEQSQLQRLQDILKEELERAKDEEMVMGGVPDAI